MGDDIVKGTSQWKGIRVTVKLTIQTLGSGWNISWDINGDMKRNKQVEKLDGWTIFIVVSYQLGVGEGSDFDKSSCTRGHWDIDHSHVLNVWQHVGHGYSI